MPFPRLVRSAGAGVERIFDRVLCVLGALTFSQLPEFMQQYLQRLEGHLDEARLQLEHFKQAAAQSGMTLDQMISGAAHNPDPSMGRMGAVVRDLSARVDRLAAADTALRGADVWHRPVVFATHLDPEIARATWSIYHPVLPTSAEGLGYAVVGLVLILALYHFCVRRPIARHFERRAGMA
ncbi:MAG TPA: DUF2937 family protein [Opitutaceae bacterium]